MNWLDMTFNEWFDKNIDTCSERTSVKMLVEHGADSGVPNIIFTHECVKTYDMLEREIWETMMEDAEELGYQYPEQLLLSCKRKDMLSAFDSAKTLKVWYMCERRANQKYNEEELWEERS